MASGVGRPGRFRRTAGFGPLISHGSRDFTVDHGPPSSRRRQSRQASLGTALPQACEVSCRAGTWKCPGRSEPPYAPCRIEAALGPPCPASWSVPDFGCEAGGRAKGAKVSMGGPHGVVSGSRVCRVNQPESSRRCGFADQRDFLRTFHHSNTMGSREMKMIPSTINSKRFFTNSNCPRNHPAGSMSTTQAIPPTTLKLMKRR